MTKFSAVPAYYPIMLDNLASRRVAEKVGATLEGVARNRLMAWGKAHDAALYSLIPENKAPSASTEPSLVSELSKTFDLNSLNALGK